MKKTLLIPLMALTLGFQAQNVGINALNTPPDASAMLDVNSTNKGLLIPRVTLTGTTDVTTITTAATSLLVYNTATATDVTPGYYYWNGTVWARMLEGGTNDFWKTTGNTGTTAGTDFLGTTDAQDLVFKTNGTENMRIINSSGAIGIGTATPSARLSILHSSNLSADHVLDVRRIGTGAVGFGLFYTHGTSTSDYNAITGIGDVGMFFDIDGNPAVSSSTRGLVIAPWANGGTPGRGTGIKIQENGFVGIGIANPTQKLHILDGNLYVDNSNTFQYSVLGSDGGIELYRSPSGTVPTTNGYIDFKDVSTDDSDYRINWNNSLGTNGGLVFTGTTDGTPSTAVTNMVILNASGNVGIGTSAPTTKLQVAGQVKITGGTPGAGKVLTSDATGLATWGQPLSSWFGVLESGVLPPQTALAEIPVNFTIGYKIPAIGGGVVSTVGNSITVPTTGVYRVLISGWSIGVTIPYLLMWNLKRNGVTVYNPHFMNYTSGAGNDTSYEKFLSFNAGDIITLDLNHTSGTMANRCAGMQLVVELIK